MKAKMFMLIIVVSMLIFGGVAKATVLGFSQIELKTGSVANFNSGKYWIMSWVDNNNKYEYVNAILSPDQIESMSGERPKQSFIFRSEGTNNRCELDIVAQPWREGIYTGTIVSNNIPPWYCPYQGGDSALDQWISDNCWHGYYCVNGLANDQIVCMKRDKQLALVGETQNMAYRFDTTFVTQVEGKTQQSVTVSNSDVGAGQSVNLGNDVSIEFAGLLSSGDTCPVNNGQLAAHSNDFTTGWRLIDNYNYITYEDYVKNQMADDLNNYINGVMSKETVENRLNSRAYQAIQKKTFSKPVTVEDQSYSSGKVKIDLANQIIYPQFRVLIDADYLELVIEQGIPKINYVNCPQFDEGDYGTATVSVSNIGEGGGNFYARIKDCSPEFSSSSPIQINIPAGQTRTISFNIYASSTTSEPTFSGTCTVEVCSQAVVGTEQHCDTQTFSVSARSMKNCIPNSKRCDYVNNAIVQCSSDGMKEIIIEYCDENEYCDESTGGLPVCVAEEQPCSKLHEQCLTQDCCGSLKCYGGICVDHYCGDGVCDSDENIENCPSDCGGGNFAWIWIPLIAFIGGGLAFVYSNNKIVGGVGAVVGGVIGYYVYWFTTQPWWMQWLIAIGGTVGGVILLYLFFASGGVGALIVLSKLLRRK